MSDETAVIPAYARNGSVGFDLKVNSFKKLFKGDKEIPLDKLKSSINKGYIGLRAYERLVIGTGVKHHGFDKYHVEIRTDRTIATTKGIFVADSPSAIDVDYDGEILVTLYNSSQYVAHVNIGEIIAQGVVLHHVKMEF